MPAKQEKRQIGITTPLGEDVLLLQGLTITEELGRLFTIKAELLSTDDIIFEKILGQNVDIRIDLPEGKRYFNGYISSFSQTSHDGTYARYHATIHPWLWFLTRSSDCRIFQNKTVPEIIKKVCSELGFTDIDDKLYGEYRTWEYCVQYRETNFNFLSRLMEQEGIYYFFSHEQGKHTLNLCDCYSSHEIIQSNTEIPYNPATGAGANKEESIHHWLMTKEIQTGTYALNEYDSTRPKLDAHVDSSIIQSHANADSEFYDYPGEYIKLDEGANYARIRIEEQQTRYEQLQGKSNVRGLLLGGLFSFTYYPRKDQNQEYLLNSISQTIYTSDYTANEKGGSSYSNSFTVINSKTPFRSARITPKPIVQGAQTAIVVGPAGEEIYTEKEDGRVKVQFHWDRYGKADENSSCWVRVSQMWAGAKWGGMHIPHVGHEVIVSFLEGDPDQPIITGRVYNGMNTPADALPAEKTKSVIRSFGDNDIVIEDKEGDKCILIKQACGNEIRMHEKTPDIEIKQECGNEILMHEAEGIQIRDKFGNEMVMDAVAGFIRIASPSHNSSIELGKSIRQFTDSNGVEFTAGDKETEVVGNHKETFVGTKNSINMSVVLERNLSAKFTETAGLSQELFFGVKLGTMLGFNGSINNSKEWAKNNADKDRKIRGHYYLDSEKYIHLIGGVDNNAQLKLNHEEAKLSAGSNSAKDGFVWIYKNGVHINANKAKKVDIRAPKQIDLKAKEVNIKADTTHITKGIIKHKNIEIKP